MAHINLIALPTELLHCILDQLDTMTIFHSFRPVCKRACNVIMSYNRFQLNFYPSSRINPLVVPHSIPFQNVTSIIFREYDVFTNYKINSFFENFDMKYFSQLKSLSINGTNIWYKSQYDMLQYVYFTKFEYLIEKMLLPIHSILQYLKLPDCSFQQYHLVLCTLPNIKTFVISSFYLNNNNETINPVHSNAEYPQLRSLIILNCDLTMDYLRLLLRTVPSLTYLKLISSRSVYGPVFDGSFWEQFIQSRFPQLKNFEFCFTYPIRDNATIHSVNSIITSFRSSFWLCEKRWFTTCDHLLKSKKIVVYTKPVHIHEDDLLFRCKAIPMNSVCRLIEYSYNIQNQAVATWNLDECPITGQILQDLTDALSDETIIKTLDLQDIRLQDNVLARLIDVLRNHTQLTTLRLGNNQLGQSEVLHLATLLQTNSTIEALHIPFNMIRNDGIRYIIDGLKNNKALTTLNLQLDEIEDSGIQYLATMLADSTTLLSLNLSSNYFSVLGTQYLSEALKQNTTLTTLDLSSNNLGVEGAKFLADALPYMTTLVTLNMSHTQILDQGAQTIAIALLYNTSLKALDLHGNCIERSGAQQFINLLRNNSQLISLNLSKNKISDITMQTIEALLRDNTKMMNSE